ncbi:GntR family transcriptional regulator [Arthrobacter sp. efr-133-TYG-120]|uniref:GntR family transcriptional regulator n=1 Tax=Arthrobacter sp. efr-133-TYG-120 TaxID=3040280 RepID=UPI00254D9BA4|nr:GntR family transcriptional regulator [Arthrobacter sp. efr-133-TYG-120]
MTIDAIRRTAAPLRTEVVNALRRAIVAQEFGPGERLVETVLCEKYAVSRTVVREALRQLESEGLVSMVPNRGPEVATLSIHDAESLYEVRRALESLAGSLFAERASDAQCTELVARLGEVKAAVASGDPHKRLAAKDRYYDVLFDGTGNAEIARMLRSVHARTQMLRTLSLAVPGREGRTIAELTRITAAAAVNRDPDEARVACEEHVRNAAEAALGEMRRLHAG